MRFVYDQKGKEVKIYLNTSYGIEVYVGHINGVVSYDIEDSFEDEKYLTLWNENDELIASFEDSIEIEEEKE
jgi:hypothetical protein